MAYSSIVGAEAAPRHPSGKDSDLLGPSDNSDSGSDAVGTSEAHSDSDAAGTGERSAVEPGEAGDSADILPDQVVQIGHEEGTPEADPDSDEMTDLDDEEENPL